MEEKVDSEKAFIGESHRLVAEGALEANLNTFSKKYIK